MEAAPVLGILPEPQESSTTSARLGGACDTHGTKGRRGESDDEDRAECGPPALPPLVSRSVHGGQNECSRFSIASSASCEAVAPRSFGLAEQAFMSQLQQVEAAYRNAIACLKQELRPDLHVHTLGGVAGPPRSGKASPRAEEPVDGGQSDSDTFGDPLPRVGGSLCSARGAVRIGAPFSSAASLLDGLEKEKAGGAAPASAPVSSRPSLLAKDTSSSSVLGRSSSLAISLSRHRQGEGLSSCRPQGVHRERVGFAAQASSGSCLSTTFGRLPEGSVSSGNSPEEQRETPQPHAQISADGVEMWNHWKLDNKDEAPSLKKTKTTKLRKQSTMESLLQVLPTKKNPPPLVCHLNLYLDPHSFTRLSWDCLCTVYLLYDVMMVPFHMAFSPSSEEYDVAMSWVAAIFWTLDMIVAARTAFYHQSTLIFGTVPMLQRYAKGWMFIDMIVVTAEWLDILLTSIDGGGSMGFLRTLRFARYKRSLRLLRVGRLRRFVQLLNDKVSSEWSSLWMNLTLYSLGLVLLCHFIACSWFAVGLSSLEEGGWVKVYNMMALPVGLQYLKSLHWALSIYASASDLYPQTQNEVLFADCVIVISIIVFSALIAMVNSAVTQIAAFGAEEHRQQWLLNRYLRDSQISRSTTVRIQQFLSTRLRFIKEHVTEDQVTLLGHLSEPLRKKLKHESLIPHVCSHPVFQRFRDETILFIDACRMLIVAVGDVVFSCNSQALWTFISTQGDLNYWPGLDDVDENASIECKQVMLGQWVSEHALWAKLPYLGDLQATSLCQLIEISAEKFGAAVKSHAELFDACVNYAQSFVSLLTSMGERGLTDVLPRSIWRGIMPEESGPSARMADGLFSSFGSRVRGTRILRRTSILPFHHS